MPIRLQRVLVSRTRWIVLSIVIIAALYLLAVAPVRTYISQRQQMQASEQRYKILADANKKMTDRATQLQSDAEIERLAREQYELVPPGQQAFAVMPPPESAQPAPPKKPKSSFLSQVWDTVTFWN